VAFLEEPQTPPRLRILFGKKNEEIILCFEDSALVIDSHHMSSKNINQKDAGIGDGKTSGDHSERSASNPACNWQSGEQQRQAEFGDTALL
jgi:hypothetical protein